MKNVEYSVCLLFAFLFFGAWAKVWSAPLYRVEEADSLTMAIQALQAKIESEPKNFSLHYRLGHLYLSAEKWGKAMSSFKRCLKLDNTLAEAYNGLGLSYYGKGESSVLPFEAIKKLFKIDNYSKAEKQYKRALELRPDYLDPLYNMGVNYLAKGGMGNYSRSVETLKKVLEKDIKFKDADFMLGIAYQHLKDYVNAELVLKRVIEANRTLGKAMIRLSEIYLETGKEEEATQMYYEGVVRLRDSKTWEDIYAELYMLMEPEEQKHFLDLPVESKGIFVRRFWKKEDPTPTTKTNERLVEHFRRVKFVRENFPDIIPPYYDDRGKVYVRYGAPDNKFVSHMRGAEVKDNESWSYEKSIREGLTFDFVRKGTIYYQVQDLSDAAPTGLGIESRMALMQQLYYERAGFTDSYNRFYLETEKIDQSVMARFQSERFAAQKEAPAEAYHHKLEGKFLPFFYNLSQFRGSEGKSRMEVYVAVPNNLLKFSPGSDGKITSLKYSLVVQDSNYVDIYNRKKEGKLQVESAEEIQDKLFLSQENFELSQGKHTLAVRVENPEGDSRGVYSHEFETRDFLGNDLMISDIQLASDVDSSKSETMFVKRGLRVIPYPFSVIRRQQPIFIYFEIYNLKFNLVGQTDYTVTHKIELLEYKRSFFSKTIGAIGRLFKRRKKAGISTSYRQMGSASSTTEYLSFDMGKLPQGVARMTVTINDNTSGEMASQDLKFKIID